MKKKFKTSKSIAKRIHLTASGLVKVKKIGRNHYSLKKKKISFREKKLYLNKSILKTIKSVMF